MSLPLQTAPYFQVAKRLLLGSATVQSVAYRHEILCPPENAIFRPAIVLPGQIEKITGTSPYTDLQEEIRNATSAKVPHAATIAYHIKDAVLLDGHIYMGPLKLQIAPKSVFDASKSEPYCLERAGLTSSSVGTRYFYHWLADDCLQYML